MLASVLHWPAATIATVLVAVFTGITMLIAYRVYRHGRALTGWSNPIKTARARKLDSYNYLPERLGTTAGDSRRNVGIVIFNHADTDQIIRFDTSRSRIIWPKIRGTKLLVADKGYKIESHQGGLVLMGINSSTGKWPEDVSDPKTGIWWKRRYWLWLISATASGHRRRRLRRVCMAYEEGSGDDKT